MKVTDLQTKETRTFKDVCCDVKLHKPILETSLEPLTDMSFDSFESSSEHESQEEESKVPQFTLDFGHLLQQEALNSERLNKLDFSFESSSLSARAGTKEQSLHVKN